MKLFVAIPAYNRMVYCETARSLLNEQGAAALSGIAFHVAFVPGCSLITQARNQAVRDFLKSDADRMIFIDSDVSWEPGAVLKLALHKPDFVGGAYRYKDEVEGYPVHYLDRPELWADPVTGLLEVAALPGGFMSLSRAVFTRLQEAFPNRAYRWSEQDFHAYFHIPPGGGEDGAFCNDWRSIGGQVWMDPGLTLTHCEGGKGYTGCIGNWLRSR